MNENLREGVEDERGRRQMKGEKGERKEGREYMKVRK